MAAVYRVRQFVQAASTWIRVETVDGDLLDRYLPPAAIDLFRAMPRYDQRHAAHVLETLQEQGYEEPDLMAAALLHDAGKTASQAGRLRLWHRVIFVLMRALQPSLLERVGEEGSGGWRRSFFVQLHHADIGAELAVRAGCSRITAELIRCHEEPIRMTDDPLLSALQAADNAN